MSIPTPREVKDSLQTIIDYCQSHTCSHCPFNSIFTKNVENNPACCDIVKSVNRSEGEIFLKMPSEWDSLLS